MSSLPARGVLSSCARTMSTSDETEVVVDRPRCKEGFLVVSPLILLWRYGAAATPGARPKSQMERRRDRSGYLFSLGHVCLVNKYPARSPSVVRAMRRRCVLTAAALADAESVLISSFQCSECRRHAAGSPESQHWRRRRT